MVTLRDIYKLATKQGKCVYVCDKSGNETIKATDGMVNENPGDTEAEWIDTSIGNLTVSLSVSEYTISVWKEKYYEPSKFEVGDKVKIDNIGSLCEIKYIGEEYMRLDMNGADIWINYKTLDKIGKVVKETSDNEYD